jgi:hypothetical protein
MKHESAILTRCINCLFLLCPGRNISIIETNFQATGDECYTGGIFWQYLGQTIETAWNFIGVHGGCCARNSANKKVTFLDLRKTTGEAR